MELIHEEQRFPFVLTLILSAIVVAFAFFFTHLVNPEPAAKNLTYWYMARSAGLTAYILLALAVLLGASTTRSLWDRWRLRKFVTQIHQYCALLVLPFLFFHLWGLHQDTSIVFNLPNLLIPFFQTYRPIPAGLGVLTLYGWLLIVATSYLRERITVGVWRSIHYISIPMFIAVTIHGLLTGTDTRRHWALAIYIIPSALFVLLMLRGRSRSTGSRLEKAPAR